jgi:HTH-type transcriptional regulator / antitoxin PezA
MHKEGIALEERLKKLRNSLGLNQKDFARSLGLGQSTWAMIEVGKRELNDRHVKLICNIYNVNESWLRTGEGGDENMFKKDFLEDEYTRYAAEIGNGASENIKAAIIKYGRLSPENKKIINDALKIMLESFNED